MKREAYLAKLKDPRWQRKKNNILERDNYVCQQCGCCHRTLHVHHMWYEWGLNPWDYPDNSLITLCDLCHEMATETDRSIKEHMKLFGLQDRINLLDYMITKIVRRRYEGRKDRMATMMIKQLDNSING